MNTKKVRGNFMRKNTWKPLHTCLTIICIVSICTAHESLFAQNKQRQNTQQPSSTLSSSYIERGLMKTDNGDFQGAIRDFDAAIRGSLANVLAYRYRSYARLQVQDYTGVINDCSEVLRINPSDSNAAIAYLYRGYAKFALGQFAGVTHDCTSALAIDPYDDEALSLRGQARKELNDYEGAKNDYTDALRMNQANAQYFFMRGQVRAQTLDYIGAMGDFTKTLELEPNALQAYIHRGRVKLAMNDATACNDFYAASKLGLKDAEVFLKKFCSP
jgi:tetratricopeptide (TPR) repeat protein